MLLSCYRQGSLKTIRVQWVYGSRPSQTVYCLKVWDRKWGAIIHYFILNELKNIIYRLNLTFKVKNKPKRSIDLITYHRRWSQISVHSCYGERYKSIAHSSDIFGQNLL